MGSPAQCTLNGTLRSRTRAQMYPRRASPLGRSQRRHRRRTGNRAPQRAERRNHSQLCSGASRAVCRLLRRLAGRLPVGASSSALRLFAPLGEGRVHRHQVLPLLCELRRVKVRKEALDEGEDEDVPERRERDEQDHHGGHDRDEVLCYATQNLRLLRSQRVPKRLIRGGDEWLPRDHVDDLRLVSSRSVCPCSVARASIDPKSCTSCPIS